MPNSAFSFTGACTPFPPSATNGTRAICTCKAPKNLSITSKPTGRNRSSGTRTSSRCSRPKSTLPTPGRSSSQTPVQSSSCRLPSITTALRCTTPLYPPGAPQRWDQNAISSENWRRRSANRGWSSACPRIAQNIGGLWEAGGRSTPTCRTRTTPISTDRRSPIPWTGKVWTGNRARTPNSSTIGWPAPAS